MTTDITSDKKPTVEIDARSGFCHGVVTAIRKAEEELERNSEPLYCLGDIVHNSDEVERLEKKGLSTITHEDLGRLKGARVLLRAHGEPPSTYITAKNQGIAIATSNQRHVRQFLPPSADCDIWQSWTC